MRVQVSRPAMLSLIAVFRDIVPGYRVRPPTEADTDAVLSKEVRALRDWLT